MAKQRAQSSYLDQAIRDLIKALRKAGQKKKTGLEKLIDWLDNAAFRTEAAVRDFGRWFNKRVGWGHSGKYHCAAHPHMKFGSLTAHKAHGITCGKGKVSAREHARAHLVAAGWVKDQAARKPPSKASGKARANGRPPGKAELSREQQAAVHERKAADFRRRAAQNNQFGIGREHAEHLVRQATALEQRAGKIRQQRTPAEQVAHHKRAAAAAGRKADAGQARGADVSELRKVAREHGEQARKISERQHSRQPVNGQAPAKAPARSTPRPPITRLSELRGMHKRQRAMGRHRPPAPSRPKVAPKVTAPAAPRIAPPLPSQTVRAPAPRKLTLGRSR